MIRFWLRNLFAHNNNSITVVRSVRPSARNRARLAVEGLEGRVVPAFLTPVSYAAGANPAGIAVGDLNGDGRDDMAAVSQSAAGTAGVLLRNADGTFQPRVDCRAGGSPVDAAAGDLNGDGKLDLVVVGTGASVLLGNG